MRLPVPDVIESADQLGRVHLVGIGGAGLSAIARLLAQSGLQVSGSDARESAVLARLRAEGIDAIAGHDPERVRGVQTLIVSTAVPDDDPEVTRARSAGLRVWPRSAGLASLMAGRRTIAVAGTHGKTTTTAMLTVALRSAGTDPGFAIGAEVASLGTNAALGTDDELVVEADESDGAFLVYHPDVAVVTNADADHLDVWGTEEAYADAFRQFVGTVGSLLVVGIDDPGSAALVEVAAARGLDVVTVGRGPGVDGVDHLRVGDLVVDASGTRFTARPSWEVTPVDVALGVVGEHYAVDAALALATGWRLGHRPEALASGLAEFVGAARRMERVGSAAVADGLVEVYDSYAHHPTEIAADLAAARALAGGRRLVVAYQPHLPSRTRRQGPQMGQALSAADLVLVADVYLAREPADPEATAQLVVDAVDGPPALAVGPVADLAPILVDHVRAGDLVVTLGAGDITEVGPRLVELLGGS